MSRSLIESLNTLKPVRILVLGDLMLDRYVTGEADRVSPEASVIILRATEQEVRPGGAAGVAAFLRGLGATVSLAGVVGEDSAAATLLSVCRDESIDTDLVLADVTRPTTLKERFVGKASDRHAQQMLRVDVESSDSITQPLEEQLSQSIQARIDEFQCVLIADYAKGVCTQPLLQRVIAAATQRDIPVLADPGRGVPIENYRGATILKPNRTEAETLSGLTIDSLESARQSATILHEHSVAQTVLITLDKDGCVFCDGNGDPQRLPTSKRDVYDITGAGDMFLAMLGLSLANGHTIPDAATLANLAAGLEVERVGSVPVTIEELKSSLAENSQRSALQSSHESLVTLEVAASLAATYRQNAQRVVLTNGCFDLLHYGHVRSLQEAAAMGDVLIVAINSDASVRRLKGPDRPVVHEAERAAMLTALSCVNHVLIFDDETPHRLLKTIRPDVLVKGGAYSPDEIIGHEIVEAYGCKVTTTSHVDGLSTTSLVSTIQERS
jgi:D-beta-D-heptose 7-phosphate kinase / D-beta-D-heptose 1-phosphate adenosyltransferase